MFCKKSQNHQTAEIQVVPITFKRCFPLTLSVVSLQSDLLNRLIQDVGITVTARHFTVLPSKPQTVGLLDGCQTGRLVQGLFSSQSRVPLVFSADQVKTHFIQDYKVHQKAEEFTVRMKSIVIEKLYLLLVLISNYFRRYVGFKQSMVTHHRHVFARYRVCGDTNDY